MSRLSAAEARRRVPTTALIDDDELRECVVETVRELPAYFWEASATSSEEYHNRFARGERGLWTHVLMCATVVESLKDSYVEGASERRVRRLRPSGDPAARRLEVRRRVDRGRVARQ